MTMGTRRRQTRRTREQMQVLRDAIFAAFAEENPAGVRSCFYRLEARGLLPKDEKSVKLVERLCAKMRLAGDLPWAWVTDGTRTYHKVQTYVGMRAFLAETAQSYRRMLWHEIEAHVELWCEKHGHVGVLIEVAYRWDVGIYPCGGYPSLTFLHEAAEELEEINKPTFIYYIGDRDPSGVDIDRVVQDRLRQFAPNTDIYFERLAVTESQIHDLGLQTRPTKTTDSRSKNFRGESVEVEAIAPTVLRKIAESAILRHISPAQRIATARVEKAERESLAAFLAGWEGRGE